MEKPFEKYWQVRLIFFKMALEVNNLRAPSGALFCVSVIIFLYSLKLEHIGCDETKTKAGDEDGKEKIYKRYESKNR